MKRLWTAAASVLAVAAMGCNRYDEYPYPPPYYQPYYQQPGPPAYQSGTAYVQPTPSPCTPAAVRTAPTR